MSPAAELVARLHEAQRLEWEELQAAEAARRAQCPDAQWDGPELGMPVREFDPSPEEQQAFAGQFRAENVDADVLIRSHPGDRYPTTKVADAVYEWRRQTARRRWEAMLAARMASPACACCGRESLRDTTTVGSTRLFVCRRCQPSVHKAVAELVARESVADGRTRAQAAKDLVADTLDRS